MDNKVFVFFLFCFLWGTLHGQQCQQAYTSISDIYRYQFICTNIKDSFPMFTDVVTSIECINCSIPILDENTLNNFTGSIFNLSFVHLNTISSTAFTSFKIKDNSQMLLFNNNQITSIAPKLFSAFKWLRQINFSNNNLTELDPETFQNTTVEVLDLSANYITKVDNIFSSLHVRKLNLSSNSIAEIPEDAFDGVVFFRTQWSEVEVLDLSWNVIEHIIPNTFKAGLVNNTLQMLNLTSNKITKIDSDTFLQLRYLTYLSLENNNIMELNANSFRGLSNLATLILKKNNIRDIPPTMFGKLLSLEYLDLSQNVIQSLSEYTFSGLARLKTLNISHNSLNVLNEIHLAPLGQLVRLDISGNALKTLNLQSVMDHHYQLSLLVLNDNYWSCKNLLEMYKVLNKRTGGFHFPSHYFDVPNLHGIACSRIDKDIYDYKSFEEFLGAISQDQVLENSYDSKLTNTADILTISKGIDRIFYVDLAIMLMFMILILLFIARLVGNYVNVQNLVDSNISL